jgi:predicted nuclease of predicted toxin-antitoxin system
VRFLADECCDYAAVDALRQAGHDVLAVAEFQQRSVDRELMALALETDRILLTEDKDFGWLVFAARMDSPGVVLLRFPASARSGLADTIAELVKGKGNQLPGAFVVLQPGVVRFSFKRPPGA